MAFGRPGLEPRWATGRKDGAGTAYSADSRIWFTLSDGILTEVFYPTIDTPQLRDMQLLITDGASFFIAEQDLLTEGKRMADHALGYMISNTHPSGRFALQKEVIADPHLPCVLQRVKLEGKARELRRLKLYVLAAPRLNGGGADNNGYIFESAGRTVLVANRGGYWLALAASVPFSRAGVGYVGISDGWTDLSDNFQMDWQFDEAPAGNVALTGELDLNGQREFNLGLAFGQSLNSALTTLLQSLAVPFGEQSQRFVDQWDRICAKLTPLEAVSGDGGDLYHGSASLLLAHEDKTYPGALIASMAIPWGEAKGDDDKGGYHLVWTRDMVNSATGLLAAGDLETPFRALIYLMASQAPDGGFPQNYWIDGQAYWSGIQLDEVAFPILLARHVRDAGALHEVDPYPMIKKAAAFLIRNGPATQQERWEEAGGYSPSTLAACIAALIAAAEFARGRGDDTARFIEDYADFLEQHLEGWTVTNKGSLHPDVARHFVRISPAALNDLQPDESPDTSLLSIANLPPDGQAIFPAREIVDAGFLELVRYGVRAPDDPLIVDSLRVVDQVLKVDTPFGPSWRRYNHDGYGQADDGGPFTGSGRGRAWPLLTGERGHYELAAGNDVAPYIRAMEGFSSECGVLPEQVWDDVDCCGFTLGGATGSAAPLMWAHAEYIKLLRSVADNRTFDLIPEVHRRYVTARQARSPLEVWKPNRSPRSARRSGILRVQAPEPFLLHWTDDSWATASDTEASATSLGIYYVDLRLDRAPGDAIDFTLWWPARHVWDGRDHHVDLI